MLTSYSKNCLVCSFLHHLRRRPGNIAQLTRFQLEEICPPILHQQVYTNNVLQNIGSPVHGKVKGQVNAALVHIKQPHAQDTQIYKATKF